MRETLGQTRFNSLDGTDDGFALLSLGMPISVSTFSKAII